MTRLITSTCCGIGGGISNPIEIGANTPIPRSIFLPPGFVPNQQVTGSNDIFYPAGRPLPVEVLVPIGTVFPIPFHIPAGLPLSDTWSEDKSSNGTLFLPLNFWDGPHTVTCNEPCGIVFPPLTTTTTWTPPPVYYKTKSTTVTTTVPPYTTELITISKTRVSRTQPTQTIRPKPGPKPICFWLPIINIPICPPALRPFPPLVPEVTLIPVPPGGTPGPTNPGNKPPGEEGGEKSCALRLDFTDDDGSDSSGDSYPGAGKDNRPVNYTPPGAGVGQPNTVTVTVRPTEIVTVTQDSTTVIVVTPTNPYPYTWTNQYATYSLACESSTIANYGGFLVTGCAGTSSTIWPRGTPDPQPDPTNNPPNPQPTKGWYECNDGETGPWGQFCPGLGTGLRNGLDKCSELCDYIVENCPRGEESKSYSSSVGFFKWIRARGAYYDGRDCPTDKNNCMPFCKKAAFGPFAQGPNYSGAYSLGCDSSRERKIALFHSRGGCASRIGGLRVGDGFFEYAGDESLIGMSPAYYD